MRPRRPTPIFFVLFPGVDPTNWVEDLGKTVDITEANGLFVNISMGEGQEDPAAEQVKRLAAQGGWIMLQNIHLMQHWLPSLERQLEEIGETAHENFRCFLSAEPPPFSYQKIIPESLLQFEKDSDTPFVELEGKDQKFEKKKIETGISDGINIEILSGVTLEDNIKVWNKTEPKKIRDEDESSDWK